MKFKKSKIALAILYCSYLPNIVYAASYEDSQNLGFLEWTTMGVSTGSGYIPEGSHPEVIDYLYLTNVNPKAGSEDAALYMLDKNSSLNIRTDGVNPDDPKFKKSIISSYTESNNSGVAVKMGDNQFSSSEKPHLIASGVDFFSDNVGFLVRSGDMDVKNFSLSAIDTAVSIEDVTYDRRGNVLYKGVGSKVNLDNFVIKFDADRYNEVINNISINSPTTPANFDPNQKTKHGVYVEGTGVKGETVVNLTNGEIDVENRAISAHKGALVNVDHVKVSSKSNVGSAIAANGQNTYLAVKNSEVKTHSAGIDATNAAEVYVEKTNIERQQNGYGVIARDEGTKLTLKESAITLTGAGGASGNYGFSPAAVAVRNKGKVILDTVTIEDKVSPNMMKGIYADLSGEVEGTKVNYTSASSSALGVQFTDHGKVSLKDSKFELTGKGSVGVLAAGGDFNADNTQFSSKGPLIRVYDRSSDASNINISNGSKFIAEDILLANDITYTPFEDRTVHLTADHSILAGRIVVANGTEDMIDNTTDVSLKNNALWSYSGKSNLRNLTLDNSLIQLNRPAVGKYNVLKVDTLNSQKGVIELWTSYGDDSSKTDIIRVTKEAKGQTGLRFRHEGGDGAQTEKGIKVVDVIDASAMGGPKAMTTADAFYIDALSDGYRQGKGTIAAGAYEYTLAKSAKGKEGVDESWYLHSGLIKTDPVDPETPTIRPEVDAYFANSASMLSMQQHKLKQRVIDTQNHQAAWIRVENNQGRFNSQYDHRRKSDTTVIHFGADVLKKDLSDQAKVLIGFMGLLGKSDNKAKNADNNAKGEVEGYNIGAYATWYQQPERSLGAYVDTWLMQGWFNNSVRGDGLAEEKYDSKALSASIEAGYGFDLPYGGDKQHYVIQPQAQVILSHVHSDNVLEDTKTFVEHKNGYQAAYRLGMRFQGDIQRDQGTVISPFAELNQWRQPENSKVSFDGLTLKDKTPANITEMSLGLKMNVKNNWDISGQFNYQLGSQDYRQSSYQIGATYKWK